MPAGHFVGEKGMLIHMDTNAYTRAHSQRLRSLARRKIHPINGSLPDYHSCPSSYFIFRQFVTAGLVSFRQPPGSAGGRLKFDSSGKIVVRMFPFNAFHFVFGSKTQSHPSGGGVSLYMRQRSAMALEGPSSGKDSRAFSKRPIASSQCWSQYAS